MVEGENGLSAKVLSSGAIIENGGKPETAIDPWDGLVFSLETNKSYKFFVGGTKWRLAGFRYIAGGSSGIVEMRNEKLEMRNDEWFTLDGRRLDKQPTTKGLYIINGKKVLIK